jgi:hypothetical protein
MMQGLRYDPSKAVTFDLESGLIYLDSARSPSAAPPRVLIPADALCALCVAAGPAAAAAFGRELGAAMGRRVAGRLAAPHPATPADPGHAGVQAAPLEVMVDHLGAELALAGLGTLGIERWGRALVVVLDRSPLGPQANALLEAILEGAVEASAGRAAAAVLLARDAVRARLFIGSGAAADRVRAWLAQGVSWGEALVKLHAPLRGEG